MEGKIISGSIGAVPYQGQVALTIPSADNAGSLKSQPAPKVEEVQVEAPKHSSGHDLAVNLQALKAAAQAFAYPLGDQKFTIYKDTLSGQYVTRFTSLRDGSVTYYPARDVLGAVGSLGGGSATGTIFETEA